MPLELFNEEELKVSDLHTLYFAQYGNPKGIPLIWIHGGPGGGCNHEAILKFMPHDNINLILLDQRGSAQSKPYAEKKENTTIELIVDLERLREHLDLGSWHIAGGSWGTLLALVYTHVYPQRVQSLMLRGLFLADAEELFKPKHFTKHDFYKSFINFQEKTDEADILKRYNSMLNCDDTEVELEAAKRFMLWDTLISDVNVNPELYKEIEDSPSDELACARLFFHYAQNNFFLNEIFGDDWWVGERILRALNLPEIRISLSHGKHDWICLAENTQAFKKHFPTAKVVYTETGHRGGTPEMIEAQQKLLAYNLNL